MEAIRRRIHDSILYRFDYRAKDLFTVRAYYYLVLFSIVIHFIHLFSFIPMGLLNMTIYNACIISFYFLMAYVVKRGYYSVFLIASHIEVTVYIIVNVIYFGLDINMQYVFLTMVCFSYYSPFKNLWKKSLSIADAIALIQIFLFTIALLVGTGFIKSLSMFPIYTDRGTIFRVLSVVNGLTGIGGIYYSSKISNLTKIVKKYEMENYNLLNRLKYEALTGLLNRGEMENILAAAYDNNRYKDIPFVVAFADIDEFKQVNDNYGHKCGDYVLKEISSIITSNLRVNDFASRWGGEEFLILLNNVRLDNGIDIVERIRKEIADTPINYKNITINVSITFGVVECNPTISIEELVDKSDKLMYRGKVSGRNCVMS